MLSKCSIRTAGLRELSDDEFVLAVTGQMADHLLEQMRLGWVQTLPFYSR